MDWPFFSVADKGQVLLAWESVCLFNECLGFFVKKKPYFYTPPLLIYRSILNEEELSTVILNIVTFHPIFF